MNIVWLTGQVQELRARIEALEKTVKPIRFVPTSEIRGEPDLKPGQIQWLTDPPKSSEVPDPLAVTEEKETTVFKRIFKKKPKG